MIKTNKLNIKQINDITELFEECKNYDNLTASISLPAADEIIEDEMFLLCCENDKLISFLSIFSADESFVEIYGLTKPEYRKKGLFTKLLYRAKTETGFIGNRDILYLSDGKSSDCQLAYNHLGLTLSYSEYFMTAKAPFNSAFSNSVKLYQTEDYSLVKQLYGKIFDMPEEFTDALLNEAIESKETNSFLFKKDENVIGIMFLTSRSNKNVYLWNFGLLPEYRGNKLSHAMLSELFSYANDRFDSISLQVSSGNLPAYRLYKKNGFEIAGQVNYFAGAYSDII